MGASASALAASLQGQTILKSQVDPFLLSLINTRSDKIPDKLTIEMIQNGLKNKTDVFLTHNWGPNQRNHKRVAEVNAALKARGFLTWFDDEKMEGNVKQKMVEGIDNASCVIVFITDQYIEKVGGTNAEDNCQLEFGYAARRKTNAKMIPVVMEKDVRNTSHWHGEVGMVLGGLLYVDMCDNISESKMTELHDRIMAVIHTKIASAVEKCFQSLQTSNNSSNPPSNAAGANNELLDWLLRVVKLTPDASSECLQIFMKNRIGSIERLNRRFVDNSNLFVDLKFDKYDAEDIKNALLSKSFGSLSQREIFEPADYPFIGDESADEFYEKGAASEFGIGVPEHLEDAFFYYKLAADKGHSDALCRVGKCYFEGVGVEASKEAAVLHFRLAAELNNAVAQTELAFCLQNGFGVTQDEEEGIRYYELSVAQGNSQAKHLLAQAYRYGSEKQKAFRMYLELVDMGLAEAMLDVGGCYEMGEGVEKSNEMALKYFLMSHDLRNANVLFRLNLLCDYRVLDERKSLQYYKMRAKRGDTFALGKMGEFYEKGIGVAVNLEEALRWYKLQADMGNENAYHKVAVYSLCNGDFHALTESLYKYKASADKGSARDQFYVGLCYENENNSQKAFEYYKRAVDNGYRAAGLHLANCYYRGFGIDEDKTMSQKYSKMAADDGNAIAQFVYANRMDQDTEEEKSVASRYFKLAADQGNAAAAFCLASQYYAGDGVPKNNEMAFMYMKIAADLDEYECQFVVAKMYEKGMGTPVNKQEAFKYFKMAAELWNPEAEYNVGKYYQTGEVVARSMAEAIKYYKFSAANGNDKAQFALGICYEKGDGVTANMKEALKWCKLSADQGHPPAILWMAGK